MAEQQLFHGADDVFGGTIIPPHRDPVILREQVLLQLRKIIDPDLFQDIVSLGFVKDLFFDYENASVSFTLELTTPACPVKEQFVDDATNLLRELGWIETVNINVTSRKAQAPPGDPTANLIEVSSVICVASCKGGVGKSSVAANLAFMLKRLGARVGLVDADVYGPSLPQLVPVDNPDVFFHSTELEEETKKKNLVKNTEVVYESDGTADHKQAASPAQQQKKKSTALAEGKGGLVPVEHDGVKMMSAGYLRSTAEYQAVRGPLASSLAYQMVTQTLWGPLDYLVIDMPPGTGDVHLSLAQGVRITAAIMVTTPQQLSLTDVEKGIHMYNKLNIPTLAVVENMSYFRCPSCNIDYHVFNHEVTNPSKSATSSSGCNSSSNGADENGSAEPSMKAVDYNNTANGTSNDTARAGSSGGINGEAEGLKSSENPRPDRTEYSNIKRLLEQFGVQYHFTFPLHRDIARLRYEDPQHEGKFLYPFASVFDEKHEVWREMKRMAQLVARELAALNYAGDRAPDISVTPDGMMQVVKKSRGVPGVISETVQLVPCRAVRLACRCAECVDEFTGASKLRHRLVPIDVHPKKMSQSGTYAVALEWSDGHNSLMSFSLLESLCKSHEAKTRPLQVDGGAGCESGGVDW